MEYVKSQKCNTPELLAKIMGPNPFNSSRNAEVISVYEMESNEEVWADWLMQENGIAVNDRKTWSAGGGKYLNFIAFILQKK